MRGNTAQTKDKNCSNIRKKPQPEKAKKNDKQLIVPMHKEPKCAETLLKHKNKNFSNVRKKPPSGAKPKKSDKELIVPMHR